MCEGCRKTDEGRTLYDEMQKAHAAAVAAGVTNPDRVPKLDLFNKLSPDAQCALSDYRRAWDKWERHHNAWVFNQANIAGPSVYVHVDEK